MSKARKELNLTVKEFHPAEQLKPNRNILIIGPSYTGKSHLLKSLLATVGVPFATLVNPTEFADNFYGEILPEQCKIEELTDSVLEKICNRQREICKVMRDHPQINVDPNACLIMDNCVPDLIDLKWAKNQNFKFLFRSGKVAHINVIFTANYPLPIPAHFLPAIDYVFILKETNPKHKKKLWEQFGDMFQDYKIFDNVLKNLTKEKYTAMVIDRTKITDKLDHKIFYYKAPEHIEKFYLGCKNLWKMCYANDITFHDLISMHPLELFRE